MGPEVGEIPEAPPVAAVGAYLRRQRELRGIELDELEAVTRIPRRSLERLEAGAFDASPDGFSRGFVRAVAVALGLDPDDTVARMLVEPAAEPEGSGGGVPRSALAAVAALCALLALALWLWPASERTEPAAPESDSVLRRDPVRALAEEVRGDE